MTASLPDNRSAHSATVLVVDDRGPQRDALVATLAAPERRLVTASPDDAVAVYATTEPDLVLVAAAMAGVDGFELCRRLTSGDGAACPVILLVSDDGDGPGEVYRAGGADYVVRPVHAAALRARVSTHLELRALRRATAEPGSTPAVLDEATIDALIEENTRRALEQCQWKIRGADGAAELLGLKPTTLYSRMKKLGLARPR